MNELLYNMIFKRKSFHIFSGRKHLSITELDEIQYFFSNKITKLYDDIQIGCKIVPSSETSCKRGEYCILLYSEEKDNYLQNIGYIGEQLDLWLASKDIGVCWYGMGKTDELSYMNLDFCIMLAIEKVDTAEFRKNMFKSKRKELDEIWIGNSYLDIGNIVRFAPSACNTQPWIVETSDNRLDVYRYKKQGKRGIMPALKVTYYNKIDIGIFMLFIELCLKHENISYERITYIDKSSNDDEKTLTASYKLN